MNLKRTFRRIPRKVKGILFSLKFHWFVPIRLLYMTAHFADLSRWISKHKNEGKNDFFTWNFSYNRREELYEHLIKNNSLETSIDYLEFGVSKGRSFLWWVDRIKDENARFYGFDTFTGLPESWGSFKKGDMDNGNEPPKIEGDNRHFFYQGLFQQTLVPFLSEYKSDKKKVIHMDADIYTATLYVLTLITPYLNKGDIILFDEFNVPMHEFKALNEWTKSFYIDYKVIGSVNNFYQMAIEIA